MKRIKQIIESFLNLGRDPHEEISAAWNRIVDVAKGAATKEDIFLIQRVVAGALDQATEMKRKVDKPATDSEAKS